MLDMKDKTILYNALTFWGKLQPEEQEHIFNGAKIRDFEKGENIHSSSNRCQGILIVKSGRLRTYILSEEGKEVTLYLLEEGGICVLSASCILNNITFDVFIDAEVDSETILVDLESLKDISNYVYVENFLLNEAVTRFSDVMWAMEQILFLKLDQRLAIFLLDEMVRNKSDIILLTHEQIAKYLGSAREAVSRMLSYFSKEGLVQLKRGEVKVVSKDGLRKVVGLTD